MDGLVKHATTQGELSVASYLPLYFADELKDASVGTVQREGVRAGQSSGQSWPGGAGD